MHFKAFNPVFDHLMQYSRFFFSVFFPPFNISPLSSYQFPPPPLTKVFCIIYNPVYLPNKIKLPIRKMCYISDLGNLFVSARQGNT